MRQPQRPATRRPAGYSLAAMDLSDGSQMFWRPRQSPKGRGQAGHGFNAQTTGSQSFCVSGGRLACITSESGTPTLMHRLRQVFRTCGPCRRSQEMDPTAVLRHCWLSWVDRARAGNSRLRCAETVPPRHWPKRQAPCLRVEASERLSPCSKSENLQTCSRYFVRRRAAAAARCCCGACSPHG